MSSRRVASSRLARLACLALPLVACARSAPPGGFTGNGDDASTDAGADQPEQIDADFDGGTIGSLGDATSGPPGVGADAACAAVTTEAQTEALPVDIIWMVDNSSSMAPAVAQVRAGLNDFAQSIAAKSLDYKVIMLSLRDPATTITVSGSARYPVCIAPPLAGDTSCGNGPRFFQSSMDIKSTQPLEQLLGSMDQTSGYAKGEARGGEPWSQELRPKATKTIVIVTDDESRLSATDFETFPGGPNPNNTGLVLPPGVLDPSRNGAFDGYVFAALYGWGSATSPSTRCTYADGSSPPSAGPTYTSLVTKTNGPRAKICDGAAAWSPFFDAVAQAVVTSSKMACDLAIPTPTSGVLDPSKINVQIESGGTTTALPKVTGASACGTDLGWYYDNDVAPTKVLLCPAACDAANAKVGAGKVGKIQVLFGCTTIVK